MAEQALPLAAMKTEVRRLSPLIAARDAPGVALRGLHLGAPAFELLRPGLIDGALRRAACTLLAVHRHRSSSSKSAFSPAYHLLTE